MFLPKFSEGEKNADNNEETRRWVRRFWQAPACSARS